MARRGLRCTVGLCEIVSSSQPASPGPTANRRCPPTSGFAIDRIPDADGLALKDEIEALCEAVEVSPVVVVAVLQGYAIGAGLDLACACDFRFADAGCRLGITPARLGLVYTWRGIRRIERLVGRDQAKRLFLTGDLVEGREAQSMGLVTASYPDAETLESEISRFAERLANNAPLSLSGTKRIFFELDRVHDLPAATDAAMHELRRQAMSSTDAAEARTAFAQGRRPAFGGGGRSGG